MRPLQRQVLNLKYPVKTLKFRIVSEGKTGFLGFGAKPAIIKAAKKEVEKNDKTTIKEGGQ